MFLPKYLGQAGKGSPYVQTFPSSEHSRDDNVSFLVCPKTKFSYHSEIFPVVKTKKSVSFQGNFR